MANRDLKVKDKQLQTDNQEYIMSVSNAICNSKVNMEKNQCHRLQYVVVAFLVLLPMPGSRKFCQRWSKFDVFLALFFLVAEGR